MSEFFNKYPYTDFHELNLDWILEVIKQTVTEVNTFIRLNAIKYADPIDWDITRQYEGNTVVVDASNYIAYLSSQAVPSGVSITNTEYWIPIFDLSFFINQIGDLNDLKTIAKTTIVSAINEIFTKQDFYITPAMFGAKGDGLEDDTDAIKACFDGSYKTVYIPAGTYLISDTVVIPDNITVYCDGTIYAPSEFYPKFEIGNGCRIQLNINEGMESYSSSYDIDSVLVLISEKKDVTIHDSKIYNVGSKFAINSYKSSNITIKDCFVDTYVYGAITANTSNDGVKITGNTVLNGHGNEINRYPIGVGGSTSATQINKNCIITDNYIEDQTPSWEGIDSHGCINLVISNNVIKNTLTGIAVVSGGSGVISQNVVISGNTFEFDKVGDFGNKNTFGISCTALTGASGIIIANNAIKQTGENTGTNAQGGIYMIGTASIMGNRVNTGKGYGIYILSSATSAAIDFIVSNNTLQGDGTGTAFKFENAATYDIMGAVHDNTVDNYLTGIDGNTHYGSGNDRMNSIYCYQNIIQNVTTEITNNSRGTFMDNGTATQRFMRKGQIIFNTGADSIAFWLCTANADPNNSAAVKTVSV